MKKIIILALGAITMVSCGNTYKAQDAVLIDQNDSINYALGLVNGMSLYMQQISKLEEKEADKAVTEFMDALQRGWDGKVEEYIVNEFGEEHPYVFVYDGQGIDRKTGTPVVSVFVINVHNMEEASKIKGKQYKPAKYSAPLEGQFTREETVQTLMTAAIATIKGIILIDELDEEDEQ